MILNAIYVRNFLSLNMLVHKSVCVGGEVLGCGEVSEYVLLIHNRAVTEQLVNNYFWNFLCFGET